MEGDENGFLSGATHAPWLVSLAGFNTPSITPSLRRLSSQFSEPTRPIRSSRRLSWVSLQGRLVGADEASSAKAIQGRGEGEWKGKSLSPDEAVAWDLFSPIHRILIVAVVAVATADAKKSRELWRLRRSVDLRDQVLLSMQQKLDDLCEQVNSMKDGPESVANVLLMKNKEFHLGTDAKVEEKTICSYGCNHCDQRQVPINGMHDNFEKATGEDEMFKFKMPIMVGVEQEERRMSDLSDWASSVTSAADIQLSSLAVEQEMYNLRRECEEKDATIKELSAVIHVAEVAKSKRITELEDVVRRKNMIITKLKKDMMVLEQKVVHLTRLQRSSTISTINPQQLPLLTDNVLYDMDSTTSSSSSDSDGDLRNQRQKSIPQENCDASSNKNNVTARKNPKLDSVKAPNLPAVTPLKEKSMNQRPDVMVTSRTKQSASASAHGDQKGSRRHVQRGLKETTTSKRWF